jgi:hypothetical protein
MIEERPHPLTPAGKIMFVFALLLFGTALYLAFTDVFSRLRPGSYAVFFLLAPLVIGVALLFFGAAWALRRRGIAIFTSEVEQVRASYESAKKEPIQSSQPTPPKGG